MKMDWAKIKEDLVMFLINYGWTLMVAMAVISALVYYDVI